MGKVFAFSTTFKERDLRWLFFAGLALILTTAILNIGIIALDDYDFVISQIIPAQVSDFKKIASGFEIRSPVHPLLLAAVGKVGLALGIESPTHQLRFILFFIALLTFSLNALYGVQLFDAQKEKRIFLFLIGFFFLSPLFLSRPLIETLASPFLMLSIFQATQYWRTGNRKALCYSTAALVVASLFRFQVGVCALGLLLLPLFRKDYLGSRVVIGTGLLGFFLTGLLDLVITNRFHGALLNYLEYNLRYGAEHYGTQPFYTFLLLFLALSFPPALIQSYKKFKFSDHYRTLVPALVFFVVFLIAHTLIPHKEERFMVPVLPLFLALLVPLWSFTLEKGWYQWRVLYFLILNFLLLPLASFSTPQNNCVGMIRYVDRHPFVKKVIGVESTLTLFPTAYSNRAIESKNVNQMLELNQLASDCSEIVAVREDLMGPVSQSLKEVARFNPGILEQLIVLANPSHNFRREAILLLTPEGCASRFSE